MRQMHMRNISRRKTSWCYPFWKYSHSELARYTLLDTRFAFRLCVVEHVRNVMAHAQKPDLVFQQNGWDHLNLRGGGGGQFSRLLAVEGCGSADRPWIDHVPTYSARLLATHSIRQFPLNFPSRASPCANRFRTAYNIHFPWLPLNTGFQFSRTAPYTPIRPTGPSPDQPSTSVSLPNLWPATGQIRSNVFRSANRYLTGILGRGLSRQHKHRTDRNKNASQECELSLKCQLSGG